MRITTTQQLANLLDGLFADRADWTSRAAADHWAEVLSWQGHPLNSDLPGRKPPFWAQRGFLGDLGGLGAETEILTAFDIGCELGHNSRSGWAPVTWWAVGRRGRGSFRPAKAAAYRPSDPQLLRASTSCQKASTRAFHSSGTSWKGWWASSSITSNWAPGTSSATTRQSSGRLVISRPPARTNVGTAISGRRSVVRAR